MIFEIIFHIVCAIGWICAIIILITAALFAYVAIQDFRVIRKQRSRGKNGTGRTIQR